MAKSGSYRCSICSRSFSMAAHLGRHMSTIHGSKRVMRPSSMGAVAAPRGASAGLVEAAQGLRARLMEQLTAVDEFLTQLGSATGPAMRAPMPRPAFKRALAAPARRQPTTVAGRAGSLKSYIDRVLREAGTPTPVAAIALAVVKAGYKSRDKHLAQTVSRALADMHTVKKIERGVYAAK